MWWSLWACSEEGLRADPKGGQPVETTDTTLFDTDTTLSDPDAPSVSLCPSLERPPTDCTLEEVRCVDSEYASIEDALDGAGPGVTIVVSAGTYDGVEISTSGAEGSPLSLITDGPVSLGPSPTGDGLYLSDVSYVRIEGFSFEGPPGRCIAARDARPTQPMLGLQIIGNTCVDAGVEGFYLSEVSGSLVSHNHITGSGASGDDRSHGIYLANAGSDDTTLACNDISNAGPPESNGVHVNGDLSVGGDGLVTGLRAVGNVVYGNAQNGFNLDGVQEATFIGNVVYDNDLHAIRAYAIDGAQGPRAITVVANTLVAQDGAAFKTSEDLGGHTVYDNVLVSLDEEEGAISIDGTDGLDSNGNVLYGVLSLDDQENFLSFEDWQSEGFDTSSVFAPPDEIFESAADLHLSDTSVAIDLGLPHPEAPEADIDGAVRPQGAAIDAGAYERR